MPEAIVVFGTPGSGKAMHARQLAAASVAILNYEEGLPVYLISILSLQYLRVWQVKHDRP